MKKIRFAKKLLRIMGLAVGLILVIVILALISVPLWLPRIANPILSRQLGTNVQIANVRVLAHRGYAAVGNISVAQPEGFAAEPHLITIDNPQIKIRLLPLLRLQLIIPSVHIDNLSIHVVRDADGRLNIQEVVAARPVREKKPKKPKPPRERFPTVTLTKFTLPEALVTFSDFSVSPPILLSLTNLQVHAHGLRFDPIAARTSTNVSGRIRVEADILHPGYEDGYIGLKAALGIASTNIPPVNAAARIIGFDIRSLRGLLPPGIATAIGGSNLDVLVDASVAEEHLHVNCRLQTAGNTYRLTVSGTPRDPRVDRTTALFNLLTRPGAFITGTVGGVADAGVAAGRTVVSTAERAGRGIFSGIANIGRGAAQTAQSAARGDVRGIGDGVVGMTYGTVTGAVDTVTGTARGVGEGLGDTLSAATGRSQTRNWEASNRARWEQRWEEALEFAVSAPFPGTAPLPVREPDEDRAEPSENTNAQATP